MADTEGRSPAGREGRHRSGAPTLFSRWLRPKTLPAPVVEPATPGPATSAAVDIVDQAEAFQTLRVADVMTPRADISALEIGCPLADVVRTFVEVEHSRMPIYRETLDDPVGVVHIRDLLKLIAPPSPEGAPAPRAPPWGEPVLRRLRREVLYVPASMRAADLLLRMRVARIHMALVIDEYGGTDGLVTLEDLVEAVVGDISDEHDEVEPVIVERPGGVLEADARTPLEELEARLGLPLAPEDEEEEIDTVAGLVAALAGRVPQRGEVIVHASGWEFEVVDADPRRIRRLRIRPGVAGRAPEAAAEAIARPGAVEAAVPGPIDAP